MRDSRFLLALSASTLLVGGCAAGDPAGPGQALASAQPDAGWPESSAAYADLLQMRDGAAERTASRDVPVPKGIDASQVTPLSDDDPAGSLARVPLERALELSAADRAEPASPPGQPLSEATTLRAHRLYTSGVSKLLDGDPAAAARDLTAAAQLDPTSPAPWLRLAQAQASLGQSPAALLSYKRAADLGGGDALALTILGLQSARTGQHAQAAHYLARALRSPTASADPLLQNVALVNIAGALRQLGYLQASIDATTQGLSLSDRAGGPSRFREELTEIAQRASNLWREVGDTASRLGDDELAAVAYAKAASLPSLDPSAVLARRVYILLRSGQDAAAALLLLDDIATREGRADARHLDLLRILRADERVGALTARALGDLQAALPRPLPPSTASAIALASAAVAPPAEAETLLERRLAEAPDDRAAARALLAAAASDADRVRLATRLVEQAPRTAAQVADLLVAWHARPVEIPDQVRDSIAGDVLSARVRILLGRTEGLLRPAEALAIPRDDLEAARLEAWGVAAALRGEWDLVETIAAALREAGALRAQAAVWRAAQRYDEAFAATEPTLEDESTVPTLLRASELALAAGDVGLAEELLRRAQEVDPFDEGSYEGLITIAQAAGDQERTAELIRALRSRVPSGRVLRWVNAQELAKRGMLDEAEHALRELIEDAPDNAGALGLLLQIWQQRARIGDESSLADAAAWLRDRVATPPYSTEAIAALGRLLLLQEKFDEAEGLLAEAAAARPSASLARAMEETVRRRGDRDAADQMALARLETAGRGIDTSLEHAETLVRLGRYADALPKLRDALPPGATLTGSQEARLFPLLTTLASHTDELRSSEQRDQLLAVVDRVEALGSGVPWQLSYAAWSLLSADASVPDERVARSTDALVAAVDSIELAKSLVGQVRAEPMSEMDTLERARAELAYTLGNMLSFSGRDDAALQAYRTALRHNPDHPWAANDLGYALVERHENLDEAERLLEHAYALEPDEPSIADSLGWLRYKLGQWTDEPRPDGTTRPGAVSLLTSATALPEGGTRPVIHDHLGDALWRVGERDRAEAMWVRAQQLFIGELVKLGSGGSNAYREQLTESQGFVGDKLDALRDGREPVVAPLLEDH